jgi:hypothetical protein
MILDNQGLSVKRKFRTKMAQWEEDGILSIGYMEKVASITANTMLHFLTN